MKMEFKNSIRKVRFSCYLTDNKIAWINPWGVQLVCMKVQTHSFLQSQLEYNQDQMPLMNHHLGSYGNIQFQIGSKRKNR